MASSDSRSVNGVFARSREYATIFLLMAGMLCVPAIRALETSPYGVNVHAPLGERLRFLFSEVEAAGIGWVRIDFIWAAVELEPGVYDWRLYDRIVQAAQTRGLEILALIAYTPAWATDGPEISGVPRDVADWAEFCYRAARRYSGRIRHWEIWNEPNLDHFWSGSRSQYIELILEPAAQALRAGEPGARIGGPALAHLTSGDRDWYRWLLEVLQRSGSRLDFVTHHVYDSDGHQQVTRKLEAETPFGGEPELWDLVHPSLREVLQEAGWPEGSVWLTETGWATDQVGEAQQANYYQGLLSQWLSGDPNRGWLEKIFFYEIQDDPTPGIGKWGLLRADGSAKPAYHAYRDFVRQHPAVTPGSELELLSGRFAVDVSWRDQHNSRSGFGQAVPFSNETGFFWFFGPDNIELLVKILDGRAWNRHFWVFYGALSEVEYWVRVTDRVTDEVRLYHNPPGSLCGRGDTAAFLDRGSSAAVGGSGVALISPRRPLANAAAGCVPDDRRLCLNDARFAVEVEWHDQHNSRWGIGRTVSLTQETGLFWFFDPGYVELAIKVLDGRSVNGHFWVFYGALSDVEYWVTVTDTLSGDQRRYHNPPGNICGLHDVRAF